MNSPIIRLEVDRMRYAIHAVLSEHQAQMDADLKAAVDSYCSPENLRAVIQKAANEALNAAVSEEVKRIFSYSAPGRLAIREAVQDHLDLVYPIRGEGDTK